MDDCHFIWERTKMCISNAKRTQLVIQFLKLAGTFWVSNIFLLPKVTEFFFDDFSISIKDSTWLGNLSYDSVPIG